MNKIFAPFLPPWVETGLQPAFYDMESGTVLQQTARMYAKVQQLTRLFNELSAETKATVEEYIAKFTELKDFVDDYFDNLDVQEEINNKLDAMVDDGTFANILKQVLDIASQDKLNFHTLMALTRNSGGLQGGCVLPDKTIIQFTGQDKVYHIASDGSILNQADISVGHANSACYCDKDGLVYVTSAQDNTIGRYKVFKVNPLTLEIEDTFDGTDTFPKEPYGIAYFAEDDCFVFCNFWDNTNVKTMWKTDSDLTVIDTKTFPEIEMRSIANLSRVGDYIGISNFSKHTIMLFDVATLGYVKEISVNSSVSDVWVITEEEWYDTRDGEIYLGFIAGSSANPPYYGAYVYAKMNPLFNHETSKYQIETSPHNEVYYIDHTATNFLRDGRNSNPFRNVYEALNASLKTNGVTGNVTFQFVNADSENSYVVILSMAKSYTFKVAEDVTLDFFKHISIQEGASLMSEASISFIDTDDKVNPLNYGDGADIVSFGRLVCGGTIANKDGSRLFIKGNQNAYLRFGLTNDGIDVETFYGVIENTYNSYLSKSDLITNFWPQNSQPNHVCEIKGMQYALTANPDDSKFYIPPFTKNGFAICKFKQTVAGVQQQYEVGLPYQLNRWMEYPFFNEQGNKTRILFNTNGKIEISTGTLERVLICN